MAGKVDGLRRTDLQIQRDELAGIVALLGYPLKENHSAIAVWGWISQYVCEVEKKTASDNSPDTELPDTVEEEGGDSEDLLEEPN